MKIIKVEDFDMLLTDLVSDTGSALALNGNGHVYRVFEKDGKWMFNSGLSNHKYHKTGQAWIGGMGEDWNKIKEKLWK